jgi:predicted nucleic acid-binding protein
MNGRSLAVRALRELARQRTAISIVTVAELFDGAFHASDPQLHLENARTFLSHYSILGINEHVAEDFGRIRVGLRRQGNLIPDMDLMIAVTALSYDLTLITRNTRHFARVPGLRLQHPAY